MGGIAIVPEQALNHDWWRGAVIYQIYPRSFADSNGDGVGDLKGIVDKLGHVASLGVDAVWISPVVKSPMRDFGYDVSDYCDIDPIFGSLADMDRLIERAHALGLRVILDQVFSHTSDQHPWFGESRSSRTNPRADWYVWADAKPDGSPPNNWQSVFSGAAWTWDARRGQYYMHNFLAEQPQLNVHNPDVQAALLDVARFWFDRGVDGFRMDAVNFMMPDLSLRDNPPAPDNGTVRTRPFDFQLSLYNQSHPAIAGMIERLRRLADQYQGRFMFAEVGGHDALCEMRTYTQGSGRFQSAYGFDYLYAPRLTPALVHKAALGWPDEPGVGWPSWAFSNHDSPRALSRWAAPEQREAMARLAMLLLVSLRGNAIIWQGEELGLPQVDIPFDQLRDPEAIANWPLTLGRDGGRTPMPWKADAPGYGFTCNAAPWLPLGVEHRERAIDRQDASPQSVLAWTRRVVAFRAAQPALRDGAIEFVEVGDAVLAFDRVSADGRLRCVFNLGSEEASPSAIGGAVILIGTEGVTVDRLPPLSGYVARMP